MQENTKTPKAQMAKISATYVEITERSRFWKKPDRTVRERESRPTAIPSFLRADLLVWIIPQRRVATKWSHIFLPGMLKYPNQNTRVKSTELLPTYHSQSTKQHKSNMRLKSELQELIGAEYKQLDSSEAFEPFADGLLPNMMSADRIITLTHPSPDEDALGSCGLIGQLSSYLNKPHTTFLFDSPDIEVEWLGLEDASVGDPTDFGRLLSTTTSPLVIIVDIGDLQRIDNYVSYLNTHKIPFCVIDHHELSEFEKRLSASIYLCDPQFESTTEMIWYLLYLMDIELTPVTATMVLYGLCGDTEYFQDVQLPPRIDLLRYALKLVGAKETEIVLNTIRAHKLSEYQVQSELAELITITNECAFIAIDYNTYIQLKEKYGIVDKRLIARWLRNIDGIAFSFVLIETEPGFVTCSLRARTPDVDLRPIAAQFGGGGHAFSSAFRVQQDFTEIKNILLESLEVLRSSRNRISK